MRMLRVYWLRLRRAWRNPLKLYRLSLKASCKAVIRTSTCELWDTLLRSPKTLERLGGTHLIVMEARLKQRYCADPIDHIWHNP